MTSNRKYRVNAETKSIAEILWQGIFEVPWHQREFDWEQEHVEQFWNDIHGSLENGEPDYFVGGITLTQAEERLFHIQDGQQRLTTYSMMIAALRDVLSSKFQHDAQRVIYDTAHGYRSTNADSVRIKHQDHDIAKYACIARGDRMTANGKLTTAQKILRGKAKELKEHDEVAAENLFMYLLTSVIANKTINGTENAPQVFETLNDRGKNLDQVDLLRNFMYSHLKGERNSLHKEVHRNLENMKNKFRGRGNEKSLAAYVRCALQCRYNEHIKEKTFYRDTQNTIRNEIKVKGAEKADETIRDISRYLSNSSHINAFKVLYEGDEYGPEITRFVQSAGTEKNRRKMTDYVREFKDYKVALPVTFAVIAKYLNASPEDQKEIAIAGHRVVQDLNALIMRTAAVQTRFAPSKLEKCIAKWGKEIMDGINRNTPANLAEKMANLDPERVWDDEALRQRMCELRVPQNNKAKRLLYSLYKYSQGALANVGDLTLEHILPVSSEHLKGWPSFNQGNHEKYAGMLGNLTLLASSNNRGGTNFNGSFSNKKGTFQQSAIQENQDIANNVEWTPQVIKERQRKMANIACQVWKPHGPR